MKSTAAAGRDRPGNSGRCTRVGTRLAASLLLAVLATAGLVLVAPLPASANQATINAQLVCVADGRVSIDYTAISWASGAPGSNPDIRVDLQIDPAGAEGPRPWVEVDQFSFPVQETPPTVERSVDVESVGVGDRLLLRTRPVGTWGNGSEPTIRQIRVSNALVVRGDCFEVAVDVVNPCAPGGIEIELRNSTDVDRVFDVPTVGPVTVPAGSATSLVLDVGEDEPYEFVITSGSFRTTIEGFRDCEQPRSSVTSSECASQDGVDGVELVLANDGTDDEVFTVEGVGDFPVAPGSDETVFVPVAENAGYSILVTTASGPRWTIAGTRDCEDPGVGFDARCRTDGPPQIVVTLTGDPGTDLWITVEDPAGSLVSRRTVTTGTAPVADTTDVTADGTYRVVVSQTGGAIVAEDDVDVRCIEVFGSPLPRPEAPGPSGSLVDTGVEVARTVGVGLAAILVGFLAVRTGRRRLGS